MYEQRKRYQDHIFSTVSNKLANKIIYYFSRKFHLKRLTDASNSTETKKTGLLKGAQS